MPLNSRNEFEHNPARGVSGQAACRLIATDEDAHDEPASWTVPGAVGSPDRRSAALQGHRGAPVSMRLIFVVTTAARTVALRGSQDSGLLRLRTLCAGRTAVPFAHGAPPQATAGGDGDQKTGWE